MMGFGLLMVMLALPLEAAETNAREAFEKGCELYLAGEYQEAADAYTEGGVVLENPGLYYYNLGVCAFRMDRYGSALACFLQARHFMPRNERVKHNIAATRSRLGLDENRSFLKRAREAFLILTAKESLVLSALFASLALLLWASFFRKRQRFLNRFAIGTFTAAVLFLAMGLYMSLGPGAPLGVVIQASQTYSDPTTEGGEIRFTLREGEELRVEEVREGWVRVQDRAGRLGWVPEENIAVLR
jgi:tetratricopeptide (TPR) repeat protein